MMHLTTSPLLTRPCWPRRCRANQLLWRVGVCKLFYAFLACFCYSREKCASVKNISLEKVAITEFYVQHKDTDYVLYISRMFVRTLVRRLKVF